jgi:hypothetical protein
MICGGCTRGDHCGRPGPVGLRTGTCACQHLPPGSWRGVETGLTAPGNVPGPDPQGDVIGPADAATGDLVTILTAWQRLHRAGRFIEAAALRRGLIHKLSRLGPKE